MGPILFIKSGTTTIQTSTVKGNFSYFSGSTLEMGPTSTTGLYSGIDAPPNGYTVYQIGGPNGINARVATNTTELNSILISAGATGSTLNERIVWATNTNSIFINNGETGIVYYLGGSFTLANFLTANRAIYLDTNGTLDTSFSIGTGFNSFVTSAVIQSDGKILVGGYFTTFSGSTQNRLIRLNSDGSKDTSFDIGTGFDNDVESIAIQSDGKILVGGSFTTFTGSPQNMLIRLNSDGSKDTSFDIGTGFGYNTFIYSVSIQSDGKILVGGEFYTYQDDSQNMLIRLNSDGSKDTSFDIGIGFEAYIWSTSIQSDGKILVGGTFTTFTGETQNRLIRLNSDGSKDTTFDIGTGFDMNVFLVKSLLNGKILVGGSFTTFNDTTQNNLIRLNSDGSKDTSFDIGTGFDGGIYSISIQSDEKILAGGSFTTFNGSSKNDLIRLNSDGSNDSTFDVGTGFNGGINSILIQSNGKILVFGTFTAFSGSTQNRILKTLNYSLDTTFNTGLGFNSDVISIAIQSDGKILAGGSFTTFNGTTQNSLIRINSNGSKDTSFNIGTGFNGNINSISIQSDGKILVGGDFTTFTGSTQNRLIRLNSDGSKDSTFDIGTGFARAGGLLGTEVDSISIQSDGKILVGGYFDTYQGTTQNYLIRLNSDGSKDTTFNIGTGFSSYVFSIGIQSDGKILVGGGFTAFSGTSQNCLIRLNSNGSKDSSFNIGNGFSVSVRSIGIQSDGKILVGGEFGSFSGSTQNRLIRLNSNGSKDTSLNIGTGFNGGVRSIGIQSDGKILVGGTFTTYQGVSSLRNILLNSDGSISNNPLLLNNQVRSVAIQQ